MSDDRTAHGPQPWVAPERPPLTPEQREEWSKREGRIAMTLNMLNGYPAMQGVSYKTAAEFRAEDEAAAALASGRAEVEATKKAHEEAAAEAKAIAKEKAATEARIRQLEAEESNKRIDAEAERIATRRAAKGKRPLEASELRVRAIRSLNDEQRAVKP
jgi:hypothetical protein